MSHPVIRHHCHAIGCSTACEPWMLMCLSCWKKVSRKTQNEVYRTVKLRNRACDETWAPWWRASHRAIYEVAIKSGLDGHEREGMPPWNADEWLAGQLRSADELERGE